MEGQKQRRVLLSVIAGLLVVLAGLVTYLVLHPPSTPPGPRTLESVTVLSQGGNASFGFSIGAAAGSLAVVNESVLFEFASGKSCSIYGFGQVIECSIGLNSSTIRAGPVAVAINSDSVAYVGVYPAGDYYVWASVVSAAGGGPLSFTAQFTLTLLGTVPSS